MNAFVDMTGMKFGRLLVIKRAENEFSPSRTHVAWKCICDCGKEVTTRASSLRSGYVSSCGCLKTEMLKKKATARHGNEQEYRIWTGIKQRCLNKNSDAFGRYGGRGIYICETWEKSFSAFIDDMGKRPSPLHSIDRIDNEKGYEKDNCRWALISVQSRNTRVNRWVEIEGTRLVITDWIKKLNVSQSTVYKNLKTMSDKQALLNSERKRNVA